MFIYFMFLMSLASFMRPDMQEPESKTALYQNDEESYEEYDFQKLNLDCDNCIEADLACFERRENFNWMDDLICQTYGADFIDKHNFPNSYNFLVDLVQKYPEEFKNVTFLKIRGTMPLSGCSVIGIPYQWLLELESGIPVAQQWAEWALLYEAGHIHHQHVTVLGYLAIAKVVFYQIFSYCFLSLPIAGCMSDKTIQTVLGQGAEKKHIAYAVLSLLSVAVASEIAYILYSRCIAIPEADDFAVEKCNSKDALRAGIEFLDEVTLDNLAYPSIEDRIAKIENTIESKFEE